LIRLEHPASSKKSARATSKLVLVDTLQDVEGFVRMFFDDDIGKLDASLDAREPAS
jgi:hypothetical protein